LINICLALCALLWTLSFPAQAQQPKKIWRIGLSHVGLDHVPPPLETLRQELKKLGYEEGKNIHLDWRNLPDEEAAHATAREFVRNRVDLIVAFESQTVRAAKAATAEIPVVFLLVVDHRPVSPRRHLCGQNSERGQVSRLAGRAADEVRAGNQSQSGQTDWPHNSAEHAG
jgi:ABC-type uncharacterized transport system substrate-binding protein